MKHILRHKNIDVAFIDLEPAGFSIRKMNVVDAGHFPYGVGVDRYGLRAWWSFRVMPTTRAGISMFLRENRISGVEELALGSFGLNLTDQYWIVPESKAGYSWEELNFFDNDFSDEAGDMYTAFHGGHMKEIPPPDRATSGQLPKRWVVEDGKRLLIKESAKPYYEEAYNEKIAEVVGAALGIEHVLYDVVADKGAPACKCPCFVDKDTELVAAFEIVNSKKRPNHIMPYEHCVMCFEGMGAANARRKIDEMLALDYLILNTDRHFYNFGVIRNANTLEAIAFAPLFDSGNSLWNNAPARDIGLEGDNACKPFYGSHSKHIELVSDFSWYDPQRVEDIFPVVKEILSSNEYSEPDRKELLMKAFIGRANMLEKIVAAKNREGKAYT